MKTNKTIFLSRSAVIAALYVILTYLSHAMGLSSGAVQVRFSEMLCVLPAFTACAVPGLAVGCLISNILTGCIAIDVIFGTLATLIGAIGTYCLKKFKTLSLIPPMLSNMLIIPPILKFAYGAENSYWFLVGTIGIGEFISVGILGFVLYKALKKKNIFDM